MKVETAIRTGMKHLRYGDLKDRQMEAMCAFFNGNDVFVPFQLGLGKPSSMLFYLMRLILSEVG